MFCVYKSIPTPSFPRHTRRPTMLKNWSQTKSPTFDREGALNMNTIAKTVFAPIYPAIAENAIVSTKIPGAFVWTWAADRPCWRWPWLGRHRKWRSSPSTFPPIPGKSCLKTSPRLSLRSESAARPGICMPCRLKMDIPDCQQGVYVFLARTEGCLSGDLSGSRPGGSATYLGGGFDSSALLEQVVAEILKRDPTWDCYALRRLAWTAISVLKRCSGKSAAGNIRS